MSKGHGFQLDFWPEFEMKSTPPRYTIAKKGNDSTTHFTVPQILKNRSKILKEHQHPKIKTIPKDFFPNLFFLNCPNWETEIRNSELIMTLVWSIFPEVWHIASLVLVLYTAVCAPKIGFVGFASLKMGLKYDWLSLLGRADPGLMSELSSQTQSSFRFRMANALLVDSLLWKMVYYLQIFGSLSGILHIALVLFRIVECFRTLWTQHQDLGKDSVNLSH